MYAKEYGQPDHGFFNWDDGVSYTAYMLLFIPLFIFFRRWTYFLFRFGELVRFFIDIEGIDKDWNITLSVDENLDPYWNCLPGMKQKRWFTQETRLRGTLNMGNISSNSLEQLRTA